MDNAFEIESLVNRLSLAGLAAKPSETGDPRYVGMWLRAGFKCEYCGEELLTDLIRMMSAQRDHLLPESQYPEYADVDANWILACFCCNQIKRDFDPLQELDEKARAEVTPKNIGAYRGDLVAACKAYLRPKLKERDTILSDIAAILAKSNG